MGLREELLASGFVEMVTKGRWKTIYFENLNKEIVAKNCRECNVLKMLGDFSTRKQNFGGVRSSCKICEIKSSRKWRENNPEKVQEYNCKWRKDNPEYMHKWYNTNKESVSEYSRNWYIVNRDRVKENTRKWRKDNPEKYLKIQQKYITNNREKLVEYRRNWYEINKERRLKYLRDWYQANPEKLILKTQKRRARKRSLPNDLTIDQQSKILSTFNGGCALTRDITDIHWDHVIPLSTGHGGTSYRNMIPLYGRLNESKQGSNIFEWFTANREHFNLEQARFDALIEYLAEINEMTVDEYRQFVYWCHENPREINELEDDNHVG